MNELEQQRETEKHRLIDAFFGITAMHRTREVKAIVKEIKLFTEAYGSDRQIDDVMSLSKLLIMSQKNDHFEKKCMLVKSILQRMDNQANWELTDLRILSCTCLSSTDFPLIARLFDKALSLLETDYKTAPFYEKAVFSLRYNVSGTLLKLSYLLAADDTIIDDIEARLKTCLDIVCEQTEKLFAKDKFYQSFYGTALVRKGLLMDDQLLIEKGEKLVEDAGEPLARRILEEEKQTYEFATKNKLGKYPFRRYVGANIRMYRLLLNLSIFELAERAQIHHNTLSQIEKGEQNMSDFILFKIAEALNVSLDDLVIRSTKPKEEITSNELQYWFDKAGKLSPVEQFAVLKFMKFALSDHED